MADERSRGIILRTRPLTETSLIVHWLTPDLGRVATVAKGARRSKSKFRGKLDFCFEGEFSFQRSRRSELHILREVVLTETHPSLRKDMQQLEQVAYLISWIEQTTETETPLEGFFALLTEAIRELTQHRSPHATVLAFELRALDLLGLSPDLQTSRLSPGSRTVANQLRQSPWSMLETLHLSSPQLHELKQFLNGFLLKNLDRIPRGRSQALSEL